MRCMQFQAVAPSVEAVGSGLSMGGTFGGTVSSLFIVEVTTSSVFRVDSWASLEVGSLCSCDSAGAVESHGPV